MPRHNRNPQCQVKVFSAERWDTLGHRCRNGGLIQRRHLHYGEVWVCGVHAKVKLSRMAFVRDA